MVSSSLFPLETSIASNARFNDFASMMGTCLSTNPTCHVIDTSNGVNTIKGNIQPPAAEDQGDKKVDETIKRRALLIGITYTGPANKWSPLDGPHDDVDRYHRLLIGAWPRTRSIRTF
jgi:hypothetical protein